MLRFEFVPESETDGVLSVVMTDPTDVVRRDELEALLKRGYILRDGKSLAATDKGVRLIEVVHPEVKSPAMTGRWEALSSLRR